MSATRSWRAWSCTVRLVMEDATHLSAATGELEIILDCVDRAASRFRSDSSLAYANAHSGTPLPIPRILVDLLDVALSAAERSHGTVDPTVGANIRAIGYDRDISDVATTGPAIAAAQPPVGWRQVQLDRTTGLLTVPRGTALDLGATAKAHTADYAARTLFQRFGSPVLVEIGGDLAVSGHKPDGWTIRVAEHEGGDGDVVVLHDGGMATSTTTIRTWSRGGQRMHHIIDPATGAPSRGRWRSVTVAAASALEANTASTAAIVLGRGALEWLSAQGLAARLIDNRGEITTIGKWPAPCGVVAR